jgi:hypothetical protein
MDIKLPFNAIIGQLTLYRYMATTHYDYLMMKILTPNGVTIICNDHNASVVTIEKLYIVVVALDAYEEEELPPPRLKTIEGITTRYGSKQWELEKGGTTQVLALKSKNKGSRSGSSGPNSTKPGTVSGESLLTGPGTCLDGTNYVPMKNIQVGVDVC